MNIGIIGTGNVGSALATKWADAGHHIFLGVRDQSNFKGKELLKNENTTVHSVKRMLELVDVILIAAPPQFAEQMAVEFGNIQDKIIIDASNAVRTKPENYTTAFHAFDDLSNAEVVKCFNSTGYENMINPDYGSHSLDMFMAGSSSKAKEVANQLSTDAGFENCYDFGGSDKVVLLEKFALSWINLAIMQGMGRDIGFKLIKR